MGVGPVFAAGRERRLPLVRAIVSLPGSLPPPGFRGGEPYFRRTNKVDERQTDEDLHGQAR